jgi:hypothetical protein
MSDLGDELRSTIDGAATPVTLDELATRGSSRERRGRRGAPWRTFVAGVAAAALVIVGAVVVVNLGDDEPQTTRIAAPTVVVGDIDLAVLSTGFDDDGARGPIDPSVVDTVRAIPGVAGAQGAMQRFVDVVRTDATASTMPTASERSAIAISWEDGAPLSFSAGGPPQATNEIAINQVLATRYGVAVGDELLLNSGAAQPGPIVMNPDGTVDTEIPPALTGTTEHVVGVFTPASGDVDHINLVVMPSADLAVATHRSSYDRIDVEAGSGVPVDELLDRVGAALPEGTMVVPPSVIGFDETLRAELEIQRAYHGLLNPDLDTRRDAIYGSPTDPASLAQAQRNWDQAGSQTSNTELRVERVTFVDNATAVVTYRAYYAGNPSPVVPKPLNGVAQRIDGKWRLSQSGICELARAAKLDCSSGDEPPTASYGTPPNGWNAVDSVPGLADAYRVVADPASTAAERLAVLDRGDLLKDAIASGVKADASRTNVSFVVSGARLVDATHAQILYSLIADGEPHLETPYPLVGNAVLVDGRWKAASRYACGLTALATLSCPAAAALPTTTTSSSTTSTSSTSTTSTTRAAPSTTLAPTTVPPSTVPPSTVPPSTEPPTTSAG